MRNPWKIISVFGILGGIAQALTGSTAGATPVPNSLRHNQQELLTKWGVLRDQMRVAPGSRTLSEDVRDVLRGADLQNGLTDAVQLSYAMATPHEYDYLDEIWLEVLVARGDSTMISSYLSIRSQMSFDLPSGQAYLDRYLWEANGNGNGSGGNGNNGGGNDDDGVDDSNPHHGDGTDDDDLPPGFQNK